MLRALPVPGGVARSIYNQDGVVSGTERLGRLLFWAMGVSNVGAMRQSGHQPTAWWVAGISTMPGCSTSVMCGCR